MSVSVAYTNRAAGGPLRFLPPFLTVFVLVLVLSAGFSAAAQARQGFSAIAVDARTGRVLYARDADARRIPASITKVMTLYLLFGEIRKGRYSFSSRLSISRHAAAQQPSKLGLGAGSTIDVDSAIRALVTKSANDIAVAVAENIAGSESAFARRMTRTARAMGMTRTTFRNASGLPRPANVTTARDLATLALRIQRDFPRLYKRYFALRSFRYGRRVFRNHNRLLGRVRGMDGLKTGYTRAAGYNLAASTRREGKRIVTVVLGASSGRARNAYMARMIERIFRTKKLARGTRIAALAGMPPGWSLRKARQVRIAQAKRPPRPHPRPQAQKARRSPGAKGLAALAERVVRRPAGVTAASAAALPPLPRRRPAAAPSAKAKADALRRSVTPEQPPAAGAASSGAVAVAVRVEPRDAALRPQEALSPRQGAVFAAVRPTPPMKARPAQAHEQAQAQKPASDAASSAQTTARPAPSASAEGGEEPAQPRETVVAKNFLPPAGSSSASSEAPAASAQAPHAPAPAAPAEKQAAPRAPEPVADREGSSGRAGKALAGFLRSWNIQLGSYPAAAGAERRIEEARKSFARLLRGKTAFTMVFRKGSATYYRARFAGFDRASARRACRAMRRKGLACLSLAPRS